MEIKTPSVFLYICFMDGKYQYFYGDTLIEYPFDVTDRDKYIVFTCAKDEDEYIIEWVDHYLNLGFDKIIICDNNDEDTLSNILSDYISSGSVEIFKCTFFKNFQVGICDMFLRASNFKWCAFFDCDEFLEINDSHSSIKDFLDTIELDCLFVNWLNMSNCGELVKKDGDVQERFTYPFQPVTMCKENIYGKCIIRGGLPDTYSFSCNMHKPVKLDGNDFDVSYGGYYVEGQRCDMYGTPLRYKRCYLKHYYTKSFEEFLKKEKRGYPDGTSLKINLDTFGYYSTEKYDISRLVQSSTLNVDNFNGVAESTYDYKLIKVVNKGNVFALFYYCILLLYKRKDVVVFVDCDINDELYNVLFSISFNNGNKIILNMDEHSFERTVYKYSKDNNYYFSIIEAL